MKVEMPCEPVEDVLFVLPMALLIICVMNGSAMCILDNAVQAAKYVYVLSSMF